MNKTLLYVLVFTHVVVTALGIYFYVLSTEDLAKTTLAGKELEDHKKVLATYKWLGPSMIGFGVVGGLVSLYFLNESMGDKKFGFKFY
jgi:hypothetical protein